VIHILGPVVFTLFVWWFSTGLIIYLDRLPMWTFRWSMVGATVIAAVGIVALVLGADDRSVAGAYTAFAAAIAVWAWHECSFLMGYVTGPRTSACPPGATGLRRLRLATESILHHELALAATALLIVVLTADGANKVGVWSFLVLWTMRISTKINLFLGVPHVGEEFLPNHLRYIGTYFAKRPMNAFFPLPVTAATAGLALAVNELAQPGLSPYDAVALTFVVTLLALAVIEHWFLVTPIPVTSLWGWSLGTHRSVRLAPAEPPPIADGPARIARLVETPNSTGRRS
jgi:putative photosynthetic complex assembly protein 2